jgi:hypothetical protein
MPGQIADADPVSALLPWLQQHPAVLAAFGGGEHISGISEDPWPHLVLSHGQAGDMRALQWATEPEVTLEVHGDPSGWPGQAELRRLVLTAAQAATELAGQPPIAPGGPIVSRVGPSGTLAWSPFANGQPRIICGLLIAIRPSRA